MKSTDNKKARSLENKGLIAVNKEILTMSNLTQNLVNPNTQPLVIGEFSIRQDEDGRYCLNDLHKAGGDLRKDRPGFFIENEKTQELIAAIEDENYDAGNPASCKKAVNIIRGRGKEQGTYVVKELVYSYAMWISAKFHLQVIRAYDAMVMQFRVKARQAISPEQQALLHEIVARRSQGERKILAEMWARHNRHFKIPRYAELLEIHFPEAIHYLETMDLKAKVEKQEIKALPYPQEVIQVARQISQELNNSRYDSWHVSARNGVLTAMPLPPGFYPTMDIAEFTKRFDSVLDLLYGTDTLRVGRHFLKERNA